MTDARDARDEGRDEELTRALAVEPLDELTRRRLVARALDASDESSDDRPQVAAPARRGRGRILAAVAAVAAVLAVGVTALSIPGGETTDVASRSAGKQRPQTAAPTPATGDPLPATGGSATDARASESSAATDSAANTVAGVQDLGDFGDLTVRGTRERILAAATGIATTAVGLTVEPGGIPCAPLLDGVIATAHGTVGGEPATVAITRRDDGSLRMRAYRSDPCTVRSVP